MLCTITDIYQTCDALPIAGAWVRAFYQSPPVLDTAGGLLAVPLRRTTDVNGQFSFDVLPGVDTVPSSAILVLAFQSGEQIGGIVPNIRGPVTLPTLMNTYDWTFINGRSVI